MNLENYLSLWIGNLGVVPLFSLAFFLFFPLALSLFFLILFVFKVFEPILITFVKLLNLKQYFLTFLIYIVKIFLYTASLNALHAKQNEHEISELFMAIGEQKEISTRNLTSYSIGNNSVISNKHLKRSRKLLIKGKSIGFSDIVIWKNKKKETYHVYVVSKKEQSKSYQIANSLKNLGLNITPIENKLLVEGEIQSLKNYVLFNQLRQNKKVINQVTFSKDVKRKIIEKIYLTLNHKVSKLSCTFKESHPSCTFLETKNSLEARQNLQELYGAHFSLITTFSKDSNYIAFIEIFKIEAQTNSDLKLGTDKLNGVFANFNDSSELLYSQNEVLFQDNNIHSKIIARPHLIMKLDKKAMIELGQETPFINTNQLTTQTIWRFSGLKIIIKISEIDGKLSLDLKSELTSPQGGSISGKKVSQSFFITPYKKKKMFSLTYRQDNQNKNSLPIIKQIPLLRELFTSHNDQHTHISIIGSITIQEDKYATIN